MLHGVVLRQGELQQTLKSSEEQDSKLSENVQALNVEFAELKAKVSEKANKMMEGRIDAHDGKLHKMQEELQELKTKIPEGNGDDKAIEDHLAACDEQLRTIQETLDSGEERDSQLSQKVKELNADLIGMKDKIEITSIEPQEWAPNRAVAIKVRNAVPGMTVEVDGTVVELAHTKLVGELIGKISSFVFTTPASLGNGDLHEGAKLQLKAGDEVVASRNVDLRPEVELISVAPEKLKWKMPGEIKVKNAIHGQKYDADIDGTPIELTCGVQSGEISAFRFITPPSLGNHAPNHTGNAVSEKTEAVLNLKEGSNTVASMVVNLFVKLEIDSVDPEVWKPEQTVRMKVRNAIPGMTVKVGGCVVELTDGELNGDIKSFTFITPSWKRQEITVEINEGEERLASKAVPFQPNAEILSIEPDPLIAGKCMEIQVQDAVPGMSCEVDGNSVELKDSEQNGSISNFKCTAPNALGNGTLQGDVTVELKEGGNLLASKSVSYAVEFELISFKPDVLILGTRGQVTIKGYSPDMILTLGSKVCNALLAEGQEEGAEEHICNFVVPDLGEEAQEVSLSVKRAETERSTLAQYEQDNFEAHEDAKEIMALADSMVSCMNG